jgi:DNA-binding Xre family transcriptional regulator
MLTSKVKAIMAERKITVRALASQAGLTEKTVMRARGDLIGRCTLDTLRFIATAMGVKVKDLFEED